MCLLLENRFASYPVGREVDAQRVVQLVQELDEALFLRRKAEKLQVKILQTGSADQSSARGFYAAQTPKLEAAKRSEADTLVEAVVWA